MTLQVTGRLYSCTAIEQKSNSFTVRTFVLELTETNNGQTYTNYAQFQLINNNCSLIDNFSAGQLVTISFNIRGAFWNDKVITNLQAWKIEPSNQQQPQPQQQWTSPVPNQQQQPQQPQPQQPQPQWGGQMQPQQPQPQWGGQMQPQQPQPQQPQQPQPQQQPQQNQFNVLPQSPQPF